MKRPVKALMPSFTLAPSSSRLVDIDAPCTVGSPRKCSFDEIQLQATTRLGVETKLRPDCAQMERDIKPLLSRSPRSPRGWRTNVPWTHSTPVVRGYGFTPQASYLASVRLFRRTAHGSIIIQERQPDLKHARNTKTNNRLGPAARWCVPNRVPNVRHRSGTCGVSNVDLACN
jgi:hypothetical protein